ncbi:hypothetical protein PTI45_01012 [Paenibacillus nuruki]|uniref:Uncharacterized protein n=1 Tax=Paenibacillus nuruki TaxID=1886670 RepID=A0A1E3L6Y4_9BACL|nr:hypothetical protein [Paenibacillus nuruki]ODP29529.1 hypothetical protein PTI45_01012 [Paenibacillus nuruki]
MKTNTITYENSKWRVVRRMDLKSIEHTFNLIYDFEKLKDSTQEILEELVHKCSTNFLKDEERSLPKGLSYSDLTIQYRYVSIFVNSFDREFPYFRICFDLVHPKTGIQLFYYHVDYNIDGEFSDEYFGTY